MTDNEGFKFISGEYPRTLDDRFRVQIPQELLVVLHKSLAVFGEASQEPDSSAKVECTLAKERLGCVSLWHRQAWHKKLDEDLKVIGGKVDSRRLEGRFEQVQLLGRLLSTRAEDVELAASNIYGYQSSRGVSWKTMGPVPGSPGVSRDSPQCCHSGRQRKSAPGRARVGRSPRHRFGAE